MGLEVAHALIRHRETVALVHPSASSVEAVEIEFDLRASGEALEEAEGMCASSD